MPVSACTGCLDHGASLVPKRIFRRLAAAAVFLATLFVVEPAFSQKLHPYEPLMMDPYTTIYVNDGSCSAGKVLKVQGAPRNQRRKKSCVPMSDLQGATRAGASK